MSSEVIEAMKKHGVVLPPEVIDFLEGRGDGITARSALGAIEPPSYGDEPEKVLRQAAWEVSVTMDPGFTLSFLGGDDPSVCERALSLAGSAGVSLSDCIISFLRGGRRGEDIGAMIDCSRLGMSDAEWAVKFAIFGHDGTANFYIDKAVSGAEGAQQDFAA